MEQTDFDQLLIQKIVWRTAAFLFITTSLSLAYCWHLIFVHVLLSFLLSMYRGKIQE
jgi:hypothetical protein